jgi:hypothetical protein
MREVLYLQAQFAIYRWRRRKCYVTCAHLPSRRGDRINCQLLQCMNPVMARLRHAEDPELVCLLRGDRKSSADGQNGAFDPLAKGGQTALGSMAAALAPFIGADCHQNWQRTKPFRAAELESIVFQWVTRGRQWHES